MPTSYYSSSIKRRGLISGFSRFMLKHKLKAFIFCLGCYFFGQGTYMYAKAVAAQWLVAKAWQQTIEEKAVVKPWSWADTWPIAKLTIENKTLYALEGSDGSTLAVGPGHMIQTPLPGASGNSVIVGHRDTHFARLQNVKKDQLIQVETQSGKFDYKVREIRIAHEHQVNVLADSQQDLLTLITCYPFDSIEPNPDYRYVIRAELVSSTQPEII